MDGSIPSLNGQVLTDAGICGIVVGMNGLSVYEVETSKSLIIGSRYSPCSIGDIVDDFVALAARLYEEIEDDNYSAGIISLPEFGTGELYALYNEYVSEELINKESSRFIEFLKNLTIRADYDRNVIEFLVKYPDIKLLSSVLSYMYFRCQHRKNVLRALAYPNALNFGTNLIFNAGSGISNLVYTPISVKDLTLFHLKTFFMTNKVNFYVSSTNFYDSLEMMDKIDEGLSDQNISVAIHNNYRISTAKSTYIEKLSSEYIFSRGRLMKSSLVVPPYEKHGNRYRLTLDFDSTIRANLANILINVQVNENDVQAAVAAGDKRMYVEENRYKVEFRLHPKTSSYAAELRRYVVPVTTETHTCGKSDCIKVENNYSSDSYLNFVESNPQLFFDYNYIIDKDITAHLSNMEEAVKSGYSFFLDIVIPLETYTFSAQNTGEKYTPMLSIYDSNGKRKFDISGNVLDSADILIDVKMLQQLYGKTSIKSIVSRMLSAILEHEEYITSDSAGLFAHNELRLAVSSITAFFESRVDMSNFKPTSLF